MKFLELVFLLSLMSWQLSKTESLNMWLSAPKEKRKTNLIIQSFKEKMCIEQSSSLRKSNWVEWFHIKTSSQNKDLFSRVSLILLKLSIILFEWILVEEHFINILIQQSIVIGLRYNESTRSFPFQKVSNQNEHPSNTSRSKWKTYSTMKRSNKVSERLMSHYSTLILFIAGHPLVFSLVNSIVRRLMRFVWAF